MWGLTIVGIIITAIPTSFFVLAGISMIKYPENEDSKKKGVRNIIGGISVFLAVTAFLLFFNSPWDFEPISPSKSTKEKCSWCGKMVDADDMQGNWCKDCQKDAFGKDGWAKK